MTHKYEGFTCLNHMTDETKTIVISKIEANEQFFETPVVFSLSSPESETLAKRCIIRPAASQNLNLKLLVYDQSFIQSPSCFLFNKCIQ